MAPWGAWGKGVVIGVNAAYLTCQVEDNQAPETSFAVHQTTLLGQAIRMPGNQSSLANQHVAYVCAFRNLSYTID